MKILIIIAGFVIMEILIFARSVLQWKRVVYISAMY